MKKVRIGLVVLIVSVLLLTVIPVSAFETSSINLEPYIKGGTLKWEERGIKEGNKFFLGTGVKINFISSNSNSNFQGSISVEEWHIAEGLDEDRELPKKGYNFSGLVSYQINSGKVVFYPFLGVGFERWSRVKEGNIKYEDTWNFLRFFTFFPGIQTGYKKTYLKLNPIFLFGVNSNTKTNPEPKLGYEAETGINNIFFKGLKIGLFYKAVKFSDSELNLNLIGGFLSYQF